MTILWENICWGPIFFQVLFPRLKDTRSAVSLTFKMLIQRKCEKTLRRKLQTEPSDAGKLISLHRASSNFSMPTCCSSLRSRAAQQRLLKSQDAVEMNSVLSWHIGGSSEIHTATTTE